MPLSPWDHPREWVFDDLVRLPHDGRRWEVVDGRLVGMSPATRLHEKVSQALRDQLQRQLPAGWEAVHEFGLRLGTDGRVPDFGVVRADVPFDASEVGTPADQAVLLGEVVSRGTRKTDRFFKPIEYAQAGAPHYWRVETEPKLFVVVHDLVDGVYQETAVLRGVHTLASPFALTVDVPALLPAHLRRP